jgi:hypothetical protein
MSWSNPPAAVDALRTQMLACASATAAGLISARYHFPSYPVQSETLPAVLLSEDAQARTPFCEVGVQGIPSGSMTATIYADTDAGTLEILAKAIADELHQTIGLPFRNIAVGIASDPAPAARAEDNNSGSSNSKYRTITLVIDYGLNA